MDIECKGEQLCICVVLVIFPNVFISQPAELIKVRSKAHDDRQAKEVAKSGKSSIKIEAPSHIQTKHAFWVRV